MRAISGGLLAVQKSDTGKPYVEFNLDDPNNGGYAYETSATGAGRLLSVVHTEGAFSGGAIIRLSNHDGLIDDIDFRGFKGYIKWGFWHSGVGEGSVPAYVYVWSQRCLSEEGGMVVELTCIDLWEKIARAIVRGQTAGPRPGWPADTTITAMITSLLSDPLVGLNLALTVDSTDTQASTYTPDYFVDLNTPVRDVIRELLGMTECGIRMETDGLHLMHLQDGDPIEYEYGSDHKFYSSDIKDKAAPEFNYILVQNRTLEAGDSEVGYYYGIASDSGSIQKFGLMPQIITLDWVASSAEAATLAATWLKRANLESIQGSIVAPMNCGQEVYDVVRVTDPRSGQTVVGRVGQITRVFASGQYTIEIRFGGVSAAGFMGAVSSLMGAMGAGLAFGRRLLDAQPARRRAPVSRGLPTVLPPEEEMEERRRSIREYYLQQRVEEPWQMPMIIPPAHNPSAANIRGTAGLLGEPSQVLRSITGLTPYPQVPTTPRGSGGYTTHEVYSPKDLRLISVGDLVLKTMSGDIKLFYGDVNFIGDADIKFTPATYKDFEIDVSAPSGAAGRVSIAYGVYGNTLDIYAEGTIARIQAYGYYGALRLQTTVDGTLELCSPTVYITSPASAFGSLDSFQVTVRNINQRSGASSIDIGAGGGTLDIRKVMPTGGTTRLGDSGINEYWTYIYGNYIYYKHLDTFEKHDDIALVRLLSVGEIPSEIRSEGGFMNIGSVSGLLAGAITQLADRVDKLEGRDEPSRN